MKVALRIEGNTPDGRYAVVKELDTRLVRSAHTDIARDMILRMEKEIQERLKGEVNHDESTICVGVKEYEELRKAITDVLNYLKASRTIPNRGPGEWHYRPLPEIDRLEQAELAVAKSAVTVQRLSVIDKRR